MAVTPKTVAPTGPAAKAAPTLIDRKVGCLVTDGCDGVLVGKLKAAVEAAGGTMEVIALTANGVTTAGRENMAADRALDNGLSARFDAIAILPSEDGGAPLALELGAVSFLREAFSQQKVIAYTPGADPLFESSGLSETADDAGLMVLKSGSIPAFIRAASRGRIEAREPLDA